MMSLFKTNHVISEGGRGYAIYMKTPNAKLGWRNVHNKVRKKSKLVVELAKVKSGKKMLNAKFATSFPGSLIFPPPGEPQRAVRWERRCLIWTLSIVSLPCLKWNGTCLLAYKDLLSRYHSDGEKKKRQWKVKRESTRSSSKKWTKTLYRDCLHCIANVRLTVLNISK